MRKQTKIRYGVYGQGDAKSKEWFIYYHKYFNLLPGYKFKTKKEALAKAEQLNKDNN